MNAPIGRSPSPPSTDSSRNNDEPSAAASDRCQAEAAFERLLRTKTSARRDDDDGDDDTSDDGESCMAPPSSQPQAAHALATTTAGDAASALAAAEAPAGGLRATVEAAFGAPIPPAALTGDQAHTFEVSLSEPMGVPMDLRAIRVPPALPGSAAGPWSLTVSSSARDAALLARNAPRLNERLRTRALDHIHVRVERHADDEDVA